MAETEDAPASADSSSPVLVLAMPRRELFPISGFTLRIDLRVLDSLVDESWYADPATLVGNLDAKEVRLGLVACRGDAVLVSDAGLLLHTTAIAPEIGRLGSGLRALRELALLAGRRFLGEEGCRVELCGYCNDDGLREIRDSFILIYRCRVPEHCPAPAGMAWADRRRLADLPLEPASALIAAGMFTAS